MFSSAKQVEVLTSKVARLEEDLGYAKQNFERAKRENEDLKHKQELDLKEVGAEHVLALKEKEFELKHFKDEEVKKLQAEKIELEKKNAVLEKELEMNKQIVDLNADVIDVKDLVSKLIDKLPEVNISNLTLEAGKSKK